MYLFPSMHSTALQELELTAPCGLADIRGARRRLARRYHPDLVGPAGEERLKRINRAADVLERHVLQNGPIPAPRATFERALRAYAQAARSA
jgi:hypothetical protein